MTRCPVLHGNYCKHSELSWKGDFNTKMAQDTQRTELVPDISYDHDGVSTIRISTADKKGSIVKNKPDSVQYSRPATGYINSGYVGVTDSVRSRQGVVPKHDTPGEIIEPVLVRERPRGVEIVPVKPVYEYRLQSPPRVVPRQAELYRRQTSNDSTSTSTTDKRNGEDSVTGSTQSLNNSSILKKSGDKRRQNQLKRISWNQNVKIREGGSEGDKVSVTELQEVDHEYNPLDNPKDEMFHRLIPPDSPLEPIEETRDSTDALSKERASLSTPNGSIHSLEDDPPPSPRHVLPFGADQFPERESTQVKEEESRKWCMRLIICLLIFLLTLAIIGIIVMGLLYAWR